MNKEKKYILTIKKLKLFVIFIDKLRNWLVITVTWNV